MRHTWNLQAKFAFAANVRYGSSPGWLVQCSLHQWFHAATILWVYLDVERATRDVLLGKADVEFVGAWLGWSVGHCARTIAKIRAVDFSLAGTLNGYTQTSIACQTK